MPRSEGRTRKGILPANRAFRGTSGAAVLLLGYAALTAFYTWPAPVRLFQSSFFGFDGFLFRWNFWWFQHSLFELGVSPLRTTYLFWPESTTLAFHSYCIPYCVVSIPFQWIWGPLRGTAAALNAVYLLSTLATALIGYLLGRAAGMSAKGGFFAGAAVAFGPFRILNPHTPHVFGTEFFLGAILLLVLATRKPSLPRAIGLGILLALTYMTSLEHMLFFGVFALGWTLWHVSLWRRRRHRDRVRILVATAIAFVILAGPLLWSQASSVLSGEVALDAGRFVEKAAETSPSVLDYFLPNRFSVLYRPWFGRLGGLGSGPKGMHLFNGLNGGILVLAAFGFSGPHRRRLHAWAILGIVFWVLSLGPQLKLGSPEPTSVPLPFLALSRWVPFFGMARSPERFSLVTRVSLALAAGFGLDRLWRLRPGAAGPRSWSGGLAAILVVVAALEALSIPLPMGEYPVSPFYSRLRDYGDGAVLDFTRFPKSAMLYAVQHRRPILMPTADAVPRSSRNSMRVMKENPALATLAVPSRLLSLRRDEAATFVRDCAAALRANGVRFVVVHRVDRLLRASGLRPYVMPADIDRGMDALLGSMGLDEIHREDNVAFYLLPDGRGSSPSGRPGESGWLDDGKESRPPTGTVGERSR